MRFLLVLAAASGLALPAQTTGISALVDDAEGNEAQETNVNSRYMVESVGISNLRHYHVSKSLLEEMQDLVGAHVNVQLFQEFAQRLSSELRGHQVVFKLSRGTDTGRVRVTFEVHAPKTGLDLEVPKVVYNSRQGFTAEGDAVLNLGAHAFTFGVLSDGDSLVERASGIRARYDRFSVGSDRVRLGFEFDSYHELYNGATELAAAKANDAGALYRTRLNFEPSAAIRVAGPLTWNVGLSFEQMQHQYPPAGTGSSNAVVSTLRYDKQWEESGNGEHRFSAMYSIRAATNFLGSAFAYTRHAVDATYHWKHGHQSAAGTLMAGTVSGNAPLFDRFVLGNSTTLRGWDKYEIDPLGGNRMAYASVGYGYRMVRTFYDAGAVWTNGTRAKARQSAGIGVKVEGILFAIALPIRNEHMEPVFIAGMNF